GESTDVDARVLGYLVSVSVWMSLLLFVFFFFSSRRRHTRLVSDWSSDVCSSDLARHDRAYLDFADVRTIMSGMGLALMGVGVGQIGRASCRERGEMSGGAVALKKKEGKGACMGWWRRRI